MKTIQVEIKGLTPIMMSNPASMLLDTASSKSRLLKPDYKKEAEDSCYRKKDKELYVPSTAIFGTILNGASFKKVGKYSAKSVLAGNIRIEPNEIGLGTKEFEIDIRSVVIQQGVRRNRIIRARPKLTKWKLSFKINYNEKFITDADIIKICLEDAGNRVGLLEFRPQRLGNFGTFEVTKFKVV